MRGSGCCVACAGRILHLLFLSLRISLRSGFVVFLALFGFSLKSGFVVFFVLLISLALDYGCDLCFS